MNGQGLGGLLIELCIWGLILYILNWALRTIAPPEPFMKVGTVVLVLLTVVVLLNILMGLNGHRFITF